MKSLPSLSAFVILLFAFGIQLTAKLPNIIFIMVDDMGYHDLGCYGSKTIKTPNIDRMAKEGIRFTDCYSGDTVCASARSTLMTGYHKGHTPVRGNSGGIPLFPEDITVAEVLKKAGYVNGGFGKWGLGNQGKDGAAERQGFDLFYGYYNQWHAHTYYTHLFRNSKKVELNGRYTHHAIFDETIKFIKKNKNKPFFLYLAHSMPHIPLYASDEFLGSSSGGLYSDVIEEIDWSVGQVLNALKENNLDKYYY